MQLKLVFSRSYVLYQSQNHNLTIAIFFILTHEEKVYLQLK